MQGNTGEYNMRYFKLPKSELWAVFMVLITRSNTAFGYHTQLTVLVCRLGVCLAFWFGFLGILQISLIDWDRGVMSVNTDGESR